MPRRLISRLWTPEEEARLVALAQQEATVLRAAAALGRPADGVKKKARELGVTLLGVRKVKAAIRSLDERNDGRNH